MVTILNLRGPSQKDLRTSTGAVISLFITALQLIIAPFDIILQHVCTSIGLTRLVSFKYGRDSGRILNRILFTSCMLVLIFLMESSRRTSIISDAEIPILGTRENDFSLIFPPIGNTFYPAVAAYNKPPKLRPRTPLLVPFTRNNALMRQAILSYIAAGWPRADIIIVDNSGTMDANNNRMLSKGNPFFLDYKLYREKYGVTVVQTPTLLNFAQLQNFMLRIALSQDWPYYFWSHMDVAVLSDERAKLYKSFYNGVLDALGRSGFQQWLIKSRRDDDDDDDDDNNNKNNDNNNNSNSNDDEDHEASARRRLTSRGIFASFLDRSQAIFHNIQKPQLEIEKPTWAVKLFAYDYLTLVNVDAWRDIGQWDTFIPYYITDCDAYQRLLFAGYTLEEENVGFVYDLAEAIPDPETRFFPSSSYPSSLEREIDSKLVNEQGLSLAEQRTQDPTGEKVNSWRYRMLRTDLEAAAGRKGHGTQGRNSWQSNAKDVRGPPDKFGKPKRPKPEPWTYDPTAFQAAWWATADAGRAMYIKKWGTLDCDLHGTQISLNDIFLQEYVEKGSEVWKARTKSQKHFMDLLNDEILR